MSSEDGQSSGLGVLLIEIGLPLALAVGAARLLAPRLGANLAGAPVSPWVLLAGATLGLPALLGFAWAVKSKLGGGEFGFLWRASLLAVLWNLALGGGLVVTGEGAGTGSPLPAARPATTPAATPGSTPAAKPGGIPGAEWVPPGAVHPDTEEVLVRILGKKGMDMLDLGDGIGKAFDQLDRRTPREKWSSSVRAADAGHKTAGAIAFDLLRGVDVRQDIPAAVWWFERACRKAPGSCMLLSRLICDGTLLTRDTERAAELVRTAVRSKKDDYACVLDWYRKNGTGDCPTREEEVEWSRKRSGEGFAPCRSFLRVQQGEGEDLRMLLRRTRIPEPGFLPFDGASSPAR